MTNLSHPRGAAGGGLVTASQKLRRRWGFAAIGAILTVGALAVLFTMARPTTAVKGQAGTPATGTWQTRGQFQAHTAQRVAVAQSDPQVVYRIYSKTFVMDRSGDGGATWHTITLPAEVTQSPQKDYAVFDISPLDANTVYLTAFGNVGAMPNCPLPFLPGGQGQRDFTCSVQYVSTDGGAQWRRLMLPYPGRLTGMITQYFGVPHAPLIPQGDRIYSLMTMDPFAGEYRLVASRDGVTWNTVDDALAAQGVHFQEYIAPRTGSTIWVATLEGAIWRSDDAGATWAHTGNLPQGSDIQTVHLSAAATDGAGASLLYSQTDSSPLGDIPPDGVKVSTDGGTTWQSAPTRGVPDDQHAARYSAMTRADGSLVMLFRTPRMNFAFDEGMLSSAAYYVWKPGAKSWTRMTPTFDAQAVEEQWLAPATGAGSAEIVWALIYRDDALTYEGDNYVKDGTYTIAGCGLAS